MPNLMLGSLAKEVAKTRFRGFNITLPAIVPYSGPTLHAASQQTAQTANIQQSQLATGAGGSRLAGLGIKSSGSSSSSSSSSSSNAPSTATPMPFPPALFRAASNSQDDVDYQRGMHDMFSNLFDGIVDAIENGFNEYRRTAGLVDVTINAAIATGGRLEGPALDGLIKRAPSVSSWGGWEGMVRDAVAGGMERQWSALAKSTFVPGLPWYPAFVAVPLAMAPPMPNIPSPFISLAHDALAMSPFKLKSAMRLSLTGNMDYCMEFFESVALSLQFPLQDWKMNQKVLMVLGTGPVPAFCPPYVPVAPVLGGTILPGSHINSY